MTANVRWVGTFSGRVLQLATLRRARHGGTTCLGGFGIKSPAQVLHRTSSDGAVQRVYTDTRYSWSAVMLDHRGAGVCRDSLKDRAGQRDT